MGYYDKDIAKLKTLREKSKKLYDEYNKLYDEYSKVKEEIKEEEFRLSQLFPVTEKQEKTILFINSRLIMGDTPTNKIDAMEYIGEYFEEAKNKPLPERSYDKPRGSSFYRSIYKDNSAWERSSNSSRYDDDKEERDNYIRGNFATDGWGGSSLPYDEDYDDDEDY